jgi:hypothetical protein
MIAEYETARFDGDETACKTEEQSEASDTERKPVERSGFLASFATKFAR